MQFMIQGIFQRTRANTSLTCLARAVSALQQYRVQSEQTLSAVPIHNCSSPNHVLNIAATSHADWADSSCWLCGTLLGACTNATGPYTRVQQTGPGRISTLWVKTMVQLSGVQTKVTSGAQPSRGGLLSAPVRFWKIMEMKKW